MVVGICSTCSWGLFPAGKAETFRWTEFSGTIYILIKMKIVYMMHIKVEYLNPMVSILRTIQSDEAALLAFHVYDIVV